MKKKLFFLPFLAALLFAGCSNDDDPVKGGNDEDKDYGYVAVNIVQPKSIGSRAAGEGFEYGSEDENKAETGLFFIFSANGQTMYGSAQRLALAGKGESNAPEVERIYNALLVIDGVKDKPNSGLQIVCVLNAPAGLETGVSDLNTLTDKFNDYSMHTPGAFIMSNSVYKDGTNEVLGAEVADSNIATSAAAALANPVDIYVERVVAKVRAKTTTFDNQGAAPVVDGQEKALTIKVTGIEIANIAQTAYLFKNIAGITYEWAWDADNKRSYWEIVPASLAYGNKSYNNIVGDSGDDFDIANADMTEYVQPNTSAQKTAVLVTAELLDGTAPYDFVYLRGGYFTPGNALALIADYAANNGYYKKTGDNVYSQLTTTDFEWENKVDNTTLAWLESYEVVAKVNSDVANLYKKTGDNYTPATATEINTLLAGTAESHPYVARYYKDGKCYYFVNIDQSSLADAEAHTYDGVVRNHIYDLALNSIKGIGTPVFDPSDVIVPDRPDDEELYYLAAQVNVLAWKLVNQTVDFE